jgi:hypothetical protein
MTTLYFLIFCFGIAYIIFWCWRNDDQADFKGVEAETKFSLKKPADVKPDDHIK